MSHVPMAAVVLALAGAATSARAQDALPSMRAAYANVDYEKCKAEAQRALKQPGDKGARVDAYKHLGLCQAALDNTDAARDAFKLMLALDREARLPDGLSPRFTSSFREAKGALVGGTPLALAVERDTLDGDTRVLLVVVTDTAQMVRSIAWRGEGGVLSPPVRAAPKLEMEVPANVAVTLVALDDAQGEIATLDVGRPAAASGGAAGAAEAGDAEQDGDLTPFLVAGAVGVGVLVLGAAAALVAVAVFTPPQTVTVKTDVAFQE